MNKLTIPTILVATVMVAGIFAFMPVQQASTVHDTIQANTAQFSVQTANGNAAGAGETITITCPAASDGCTILDVIIFNDDNADPLVLDTLVVTFNALTGTPSTADLLAGTTNIATNTVEYEVTSSGLILAGGDVIVITPTAGSNSILWEVQVIAQVEGGVGDISVVVP